VLAQTTHISLLARLGGDHDPVAWDEFCRRYGELIRNFARAQGLQPADCDDVLQDVLLSLTKAIPGFEYDPARGKFRSYLKTITLHAIFARSRQKRGEVALEESGRTAAEAAAREPQIDAIWDEQWRQYHLNLAMHRISAEFNELDLAAFRHYAIQGNSPKETAESFGLSVNQVYQAKSRILRRLSGVIQEQVTEEG
jgi:RNA polymerase sigma-70 factor (ECF subfamily)